MSTRANPNPVDKIGWRCQYPSCNDETVYATKELVDAHAQQRHNVSSAAFSCLHRHTPDIEYKWSAQSGQRLAAHMNGHSGETPFKCEEDDCLAGVRTWEGLDYHKKAIHVGNK